MGCPLRHQAARHNSPFIEILHAKKLHFGVFQILNVSVHNGKLSLHTQRTYAGLSGKKRLKLKIGYI
jgi:hypothetical protein